MGFGHLRFCVPSVPRRAAPRHYREAPRRATTARTTCGKVLRPQGVESHLASVVLAVDGS